MTYWCISSPFSWCSSLNSGDLFSIPVQLRIAADLFSLRIYKCDIYWIEYFLQMYLAILTYGFHLYDLLHCFLTVLICPGEKSSITIAINNCWSIEYAFFFKIAFNRFTFIIRQSMKLDILRIFIIFRCRQYQKRVLLVFRAFPTFSIMMFTYFKYIDFIKWIL